MEYCDEGPKCGGDFQKNEAICNEEVEAFSLTKSIRSCGTACRGVDFMVFCGVEVLGGNDCGFLF